MLDADGLCSTCILESENEADAVAMLSDVEVKAMLLSQGFTEESLQNVEKKLAKLLEQAKAIIDAKDQTKN